MLLCLIKIKMIAVFAACGILLQADAKDIDRVFVKAGNMLYKGVAVAVEDFEISKYEITNERYAAFLNSKLVGIDGKYKGRLLINVASEDLQLEFVQKKWVSKNGYEQHPMVMVNYYGAVEFCKWMGGRLPTGAEWLYAAQGGAKTKQYSFAGSNRLEEVGWYKNNSNQHSYPVGQKKPNNLGIYDMSGNAWEWCRDDNPVNDSSFCLHMGGSWYSGEQPCKLDARYGNTPTHFSNSVGFRVVFTADAFLINKNFFKKYKGKPWNNTPQQIPGRLQCEWYDMGGEGVSYHDNDSINNGSGKLNPPNGTFLNEFRMHEGVDISYTKSRDIDNNPFNLVQPEMDQFYAGWTIPGEWINYSVTVKESGSYTVGLMYTASGDGEIALLIDGKPLTTALFIPSVRNEKETIDWRNWHHWNKIDTLATVPIKKGAHVLTLKTISNGNMNYEYLEFKLNQ